MGEVISSKPLISIVLPTYNRAKFLPQCINSVINQDYQNWELLIIDNNSTDDTDLVIEKFVDSRVKLFKINNEGLIGRSRNLGIKHSKGEWIAFLDSDDWWLENKLTKTLDACTNYTDLIFHDLRIAFDEKISFFHKVKGWSLRTPVLEDLLIRGNAIANSSVMVRKSVLTKAGEINEESEINPCVDYNTWLKVAAVTNSFVYISNALGVYRVHSGGVSQRDMSFSHKRAISDYLSTLSEQQQDLVEKKILYMHARFLFVGKNFKEALPLLCQCLSIDFKTTAKVLIMLFVISISRAEKKI